MIAHEYVYDFMLAGRCEVTFNNLSTGNQFKVFIYGWPKHTSVKDTRSFTRWYVRDAGFNKIGYIRGDVFIPEGDRRENQRKFRWIWKHVVAKTIPIEMEVMHHNKCGRCTRPLTDAESIKRGLGPICFAKMGQVPMPDSYYAAHADEGEPDDIDEDDNEPINTEPWIDTTSTTTDLPLGIPSVFTVKEDYSWEGYPASVPKGR